MGGPPNHPRTTFSIITPQFLGLLSFKNPHKFWCLEKLWSINISKRAELKRSWSLSPCFRPLQMNAPNHIRTLPWSVASNMVQSDSQTHIIASFHDGSDMANPPSCLRGWPVILMDNDVDHKLGAYQHDGFRGEGDRFFWIVQLWMISHWGRWSQRP